MFKHRFTKLLLATTLLSTAPLATANIFHPAQANTGDTVLVTANGIEFTQDMANVWIILGEFMADAQFTPEERAWISQREAEHFARDPQKGISDLKGLQSTFEEIKALESDPIKLARYREDLFDGTHLNRFKAGKTDTQDYLTVVYRYDPVIHTDVESGLVITAMDLASLNAANNFISQIAFERDYYSADNIETLKQRFTSYYPQASAEEKRLYAKAEGRWNALAQGWTTLSPNGQQQIADKVAVDAQEPQNVPAIARILENFFYYTEKEKTAQAQQPSQATQQSGQLSPQQQQSRETMDTIGSRLRAERELNKEYYNLMIMQSDSFIPF